MQNSGSYIGGEIPSHKFCVPTGTTAIGLYHKK